MKYIVFLVTAHSFYQPSFSDCQKFFDTKKEALTYVTSGPHPGCLQEGARIFEGKELKLKYHTKVISVEHEEIDSITIE